MDIGITSTIQAASFIPSGFHIRGIITTWTVVARCGQGGLSTTVHTITWVRTGSCGRVGSRMGVIGIT